MKKIDLHIHTTCSDGAFSPKEVIDEALKNGVEVISIADHDTIDAYTQELLDYAKSKNIKIIKAVEISTKTAKAGIHVLGYNFDINNREFREKLSLLKNARHDYLHNVAKKLEDLGYKLNVEKLDEIEAVTKAHISLDIINSKENEEKLIKDFGHIPNKGEFIETVMNEGCPAYVKKETITPKEAAILIRNAGGKVVLAHPVAYQHEDNLTDEEISNLILDMKPNGLEAYYIYVDKDNQKFDETAKWKKFAKKHNLFVTVGSDFHCMDNLRPKIGLGEDLNLESEEIEEIIKNLEA